MAVFRITAIAVVMALVASVAVGISPTWFSTRAALEATTSRYGDDLATLAPGPAVLALTPPMGWNGFNHFYLKVDESTVEATARALVASGMKAAGYVFVNLDGGWDLPMRDVRHDLQPDPAKFPRGIWPVADYIHSLGLKFGIYSSAGTMNCASTSAGSFGHYQQDAAAFAAWGVDYLKLDWCHIPYADFPRMTHRQVSVMLAMQMREALAATGRPIVFDVNNWTDEQPWAWARGVGQLWRTAPDIHDHYASLVWNFTHNVSHFGQAGPGGWNDPDMLEIGNGGMSATEYQSQFSLWAEMAAPLIAGNDITRMSPITQGMLTNQAVIAVDQDPLGLQGYSVANGEGHWVLTRPLENGDRAVVLFNQTDQLASISTTVSQVGLAGGPEYMLIDLWSGATTPTGDAIAAIVPAHGVVMYRISTIGTPQLRI
jgi:alpha-galactosidase